MRRLSLIVSIVLFALVMPAFAQKEPVAARKPLRFWVERLSHKDPKVREKAAKFLESEAGGFLTWWQVGYLVHQILDVKTKKRLVAFRQEAKPLIPELLKSLKSTDENVVDAASLMLIAMGPDGLASSPYLERIVLDKKTANITRIAALHSLFFITPEDQPVGPVFLKLLNSLPNETLKLFVGEDQDTINEYKEKSINLQISTIIALSMNVYIGPLALSGHTKSEVPSLVKIASGEYPPAVRAFAIGILGAMTFDAKSSVPALRKLLKDEDRFIRDWAASSLIQIEPDPKLVPVIVEALKFKGKEREKYEKEMREYFKQHEEQRKSWREFGSNKASLAYLVHQLKHGNGFFRRQAIQYLAQIGPGAKSVVPELRKLLKDPDEDTRRMAAEALKQIQSEVVKSNGK